MSNPIASETEPEICDKCKMELGPGTFHVGCIPQPDEPASDPSGKLDDTLPLPVTVINGEKCCAACCKPIFQEVPSGKGAREWLTEQKIARPPNAEDEMYEITVPVLDIAGWLEQYAASLRQQLSDAQDELRDWKITATEVVIERDEAQGRVSQLEAELKDAREESRGFEIERSRNYDKFSREGF